MRRCLLLSSAFDFLVLANFLFPSLFAFISYFSQVIPDCVALCTVDGQRTVIGEDSDICLQELGHCIAYLIARQNLGREDIHKIIGLAFFTFFFIHQRIVSSGKEYSGLEGNAIALNNDPVPKPHNPLTDLGALASCSLIKV